MSEALRTSWSFARDRGHAGAIEGMPVRSRAAQRDRGHAGAIEAGPVAIEGSRCDRGHAGAIEGKRGPDRRSGRPEAA